MNVGHKFFAHRFKKDREAGYFDAAARTSRARAHKHQEHKNDLAGLIPHIEIGGGKSGRRDDRCHLKGRLCQRVEGIGADAEDIHEDDRYGGGDDKQIVAYFFHFQGLLHLAEEKQIVSVEVDPEQDHKYCDDPLYIGGIVRYTAVPDAEAARSGRAEGGTHRVEDGHPAEQQQDHFRDGHAEIDQVQEARRISDLGDELADGRPGAFGAHQVDV